MSAVILSRPIVGFRPHPLAPPQMKQARLGACLWELAADLPETTSLLVCSVDGAYILRENWGITPRPGEVVMFTSYPEKAGAFTFVLGLIIEAIGIYFAQPELVSLGAQLELSGAVSVALSLLTPNRAAGQDQQAPGSGVYSTSLAGNAARLDQPIWKVCGRPKITPPFASGPYVEYQPSNPANPDLDCDQYYFAVFALGVGDVDIEKSFIGKTALAHFQDVQRATYLPPGVQPTVAQCNVVTSEEVGTALDMKKGRYIGGYAACRPHDIVVKVGVDVAAEQGLAKTNSDGSAGTATVTWIVQVREIDDFGTAIGNWTTIATETRAQSTNTPQRWGKQYTLVSPMRCEVRVARTDNYQSGDSTARDALSWIGLRGYLGRPVVPATGDPVTSYGATLSVLAWYDAAAGTSSLALTIPTPDGETSVAYRNPPDAADSSYWLGLLTATSAGVTSYYTDNAGVPAFATTANYGLMVFDSAAGNYFAIGPAESVAGAVTQYEYRVALDGTLISKTAMTNGAMSPVGAFPQGAMIFFNGAWRAWIGNDLSTYWVRDAGAPHWTILAAPGGAYGVAVGTTSSGSSNFGYVIGAHVISGDLVLVTASTGGSAGLYKFLGLVSSPDSSLPFAAGLSFSLQVDGTVTPPPGVSAFSDTFATLYIDSGLSTVTVRVGVSKLFVYFHRFGTSRAAVFDTAAGTVTDTPLTLDGAPLGVLDSDGVRVTTAGTPEWTLTRFVGNAAGSYVVAAASRYSGPFTFDHHLAVSTDGLAFTTVADSALLSTAFGMPFTDVGQFNSPLFSQGTKFLYARAMAGTTITPPGGTLPGPFAPLNPNVAHFEVVMRSGSQLSGQAQRDFSMIVRGKVRTWSPSHGWTAPVFTRNAAWWLADLWTNPIWGEGLPDSRIDLLGLYNWSLTLDARQDHFDYCFSTATSSWEAAQLIAATGRAHVSRRAGVYTVTRDEAVVLPVAAISSRNTAPGSMVIHASLPQLEQSDGIVATYTSNVTWDDVNEECPCPGFSATDRDSVFYNPALPQMQNPVFMSFPGITGSFHARREGIYHAADMALRRTTATATMEMEGQVLAFLDPVLFQPQLIGYGQAGDVVDFDNDTLVMTLTEPPDFSLGVPYLTLQRDDMTLTTAVPVAPGPTPYSVTLPVMPDFGLFLDYGNRERPKYLLGLPATSAEIAKATALTDGGKTDNGAPQVDVQLTIDDIRVHEADNALLPGPGDVQDPIDNGTTASDIPYTATVNIDANRNKGQDHSTGGVDHSGSEHGVTISGLNPDWDLALSLADGPYVAWSEWASDGDPYVTHPGMAWGNSFMATSDLGTGGESFGAMSIASTAEGARALFSGGTLSGSTSWTFWFNSDSINDNRGGLSIVVTRVG